MAEFPTPTISGSSSNGRTSRLQRENARSIRVDSMGPSSKGKTPRSQRGDACSSHASSTSRGDAGLIPAQQLLYSKIRSNTGFYSGWWCN